MLHVVETVVVGLPDIQGRAGNRVSCDVEHPAADQRRLALAVQANVRAVLVARRVGHVERTEDRIRRGALRPPMVDCIHQHGRAQHVRQQDVFLAPVGAHLPGSGEELDGLEPLIMGRFDFLDGRVQMPGQYRHDLNQTRVVVGRVAGIDDLGGVFLFEKAANGDVVIQLSSHDLRSLFHCS
ncbi:hypothetical protein D3C71_1620360 [compost metagenome]